MSSQTNLTTRRQFLERSAWGFGSAFLLPSLLASCTDHVVPPTGPGSPVIPPLLGNYQINFNDAARTAVIAGLGAVPEVGEILGPLVDIFWPQDQPSPWDEVRAQVEKLIDQKISDLVYQQVTDKLAGYESLMSDYLSTMQDGANSEKAAEFVSVRNIFDVDERQFQSQGYELLLLPLYVHFVNMRLSVLRDAVLKGQDWGRTPAEYTDDVNNLKKRISAAATYTQNTVDKARQAMVSKTPEDCKTMEPFKTLNNFDRQMYLSVLDFKETWQYFDPIVYPNQVKVVFNRIIYSDPMGTGADSGCGYIVYPTWPTQPISQITAWSNKYIDAFQVTYPSGGGPDGKDDTGPMGYTTAPGAFKRTWTIDPNNPVVAVDCSWGTTVNTMQFHLYDQNTPPLDFLGELPEGDSKWPWQYGSERLALIIARGVNYDLNAIGNIILGFQLWDEPSTLLRGVRDIYVKSPKEHTAADLAKAFPKLVIEANFIDNTLKAARKEYWERIKARAKKPK